MSRTPARPSRQRAAIVARSEHADLDPRVVIVDPTFAATLTTQHARSFVVVLGRAGVGADTFTRDLPNASDEALAHLDARGLATPGSRVEPGTILVGKVTPESDGPSSPEELLLRAIFGETASAARDTSLRAPPRCVGAVISASIEDDRAEVFVAWERPLEVGDVLIVDGERLAVAQIEPRTADIARAGGGGHVSIVKGAMARDALMARSIGPYEAPYDQPIRDPDGLAGQVVARATLAALATAAPWAAWEMLTIKADSPTGRARLYESLVKQERPDVSPQQPAPTAAAPVTPRSTDIFSFFEKEPGPGPGQLAPQQPEVVTMLALYLRALGLEVDLQTQAVGVKFLAPEQVREASHGELRGADDLASQRVFGPVRDYACACGKYQRMRHRGVVCEVCGVEVVTSRVRRTRCGHIELAAPCVHPLLSDAARRGRGRARDRPLVAGDAPMLMALVVLPPPLRGPAIDAAYARVLAADGDALQGAVDHLFAQLADAVDTTLHPRMYTKAVDYSGAAHLVVDPSLAPGQCRVPRSLLLELFRPQAYGLLEIHGYVTTIKAGKRMLEQQRPCALAMVAEASEGYPVLLAAGAAVVARRVSAWDAPAIGVDAATAALLAARVVALHVPVSYQAALTVAALGDLSRAPSTASDGWLARARRDGQFVAAALHAAVFGELDPIEDLVVHVALGRVPDPIDEGALGHWQSVEQARQRAIHDEYAERAAADPEPVPDLLGRCVDELELSRARPT